MAGIRISENQFFKALYRLLTNIPTAQKQSNKRDDKCGRWYKCYQKNNICSRVTREPLDKIPKFFRVFVFVSSFLHPAVKVEIHLSTAIIRLASQCDD